MKQSMTTGSDGQAFKMTLAELKITFHGEFETNSP